MHSLAQWIDCGLAAQNQRIVRGELINIFTVRSCQIDITGISCHLYSFFTHVRAHTFHNLIVAFQSVNSQFYTVSTPLIISNNELK